MVWYNTSNFTSQDAITNLIRVANEYTQQWFGTLILLGFFIITMVVLMRYEMKHRITVASWTTALIGILYVPLGIINMWVIYLMLILFVGGFVGLLWE